MYELLLNVQAACWWNTSLLVLLEAVTVDALFDDVTSPVSQWMGGWVGEDKQNKQENARGGGGGGGWRVRA